MTVSYDPLHSHVAFSIAMVVLVIGGLNWGVVGVRMLAGNRSVQPQDMFSWSPWWVQMIVYFLVLIAVIVVLGFWIPNKQCEECKCTTRVINIKNNPHQRFRPTPSCDGSRDSR